MVMKTANKYPWLSVKTDAKEYLIPAYYDRILKEYRFGGKSDLELLKAVAIEISKTAEVVEFGSGTGRATKTVIDSIEHIERLTLVDLSKRMLARCKQRFSGLATVRYVASDTIDFLIATKKEYDFAFSLWSFSHSTHQTLSRLGMRAGTKKIRRAVEKFLTKNLRHGGSFFLIHFDSLSEEQKISIKQRRRTFSIFKNNTKQSPSKLLLDKILEHLRKRGVIDFTCKHYVGDPIQFHSLDEVLEYYLNFHMESHFNTSDSINKIIKELSADIEKCRDHDGVIKITPGCFVYNIVRR
jgi:SAM-dependent methyltransferase